MQRGRACQGCVGHFLTNPRLSVSGHAAEQALDLGGEMLARVASAGMVQVGRSGEELSCRSYQTVLYSQLQATAQVSTWVALELRFVSFVSLPPSATSLSWHPTLLHRYSPARLLIDGLSTSVGIKDHPTTRAEGATLWLSERGKRGKDERKLESVNEQQRRYR